MAWWRALTGELSALGALAVSVLVDAVRSDATGHFSASKATRSPVGPPHYRRGAWPRSM
jgi:hypothetical protein